jgi:hypothetical protein
MPHTNHDKFIRTHTITYCMQRKDNSLLFAFLQLSLLAVCSVLNSRFLVTSSHCQSYFLVLLVQFLLYGCASPWCEYAVLSHVFFWPLLCKMLLFVGSTMIYLR